MEKRNTITVDGPQGKEEVVIPRERVGILAIRLILHDLLQ